MSNTMKNVTRTNTTNSTYSTTVSVETMKNLINAVYAAENDNHDWIEVDAEFTETDIVYTAIACGFNEDNLIAENAEDVVEDATFYLANLANQFPIDTLYEMIDE